MSRSDPEEAISGAAAGAARCGILCLYQALFTSSGPKSEMTRDDVENRNPENVNKNA
eukprot:gene17656-biopygen17324